MRSDRVEKPPRRGFRSAIAAWAVLTLAFLACAAASHGQEPESTPPQKITVVSDDSYPPYIFRDEHGALQGIIVDQWRLWEKQTGVEVELVGMSWIDAQAFMAAGRADVMDTVFQTEERAGLYDFTGPYATLDVAIFFHKRISGITDVDSARGFTIGVKSGDACIPFLEHGGITTLREFPDYESIIMAADKGLIRVFCMDHPPAFYYLHKHHQDDDFRRTEPLYSGQFHRAVKKGRTDLLQLVEEGFTRIPKAEYTRIEQKWLGSPMSVDSVFVRYLLYAMVAGVVLVLGLVTWNQTLRRRVSNRTRLLEDAAAAMRQSEERLTFVLEGSRLGYWDWDIRTGEVRRNERWAQMLGYSLDEMDSTIDQWKDLVHPDDREEAARSVRDHLEGRTALHVGEYRMKAKSGEYVWILDRACIVQRDAAGHPLRMCGTHADITERKLAEEERQRFEAQVQQTQKLESLGVLAGGIAHDFNNLLMAILGNADLAMQDVSDLSPAYPMLEEIGRAARRAAELCKQMLAYSGKGKFVVRAFDLSQIVREMEHMIQVSISKKAVLRVDLTPGLPTIEADASQIRQVVMNLTINASEAIGDRSGVISVTTGMMSCDEDYLRNTLIASDLPPGEYVFLEVQDTGCGMDPETISHVFEPFYTTKFTGRGLGLAAVLGIVRGHHGAIKIYSEIGRGTTFKILFPACESAPDSSDATEPARAAWQGKGLILLVDDEETIRAIGKRMLERMGFSVLLASDGREALEIYRKRADEIACVLLDLTMPHMDGEETFRELRRIRPAVRVVISSGYNEQEISQRFLGKGLAGVMQKPYQSTQLAAVIRQALNMFN